jgi:hypothetical protein
VLSSGQMFRQDSIFQIIACIHIFGIVTEHFILKDLRLLLLGDTDRINPKISLGHPQ